MSRSIGGFKLAKDPYEVDGANAAIDDKSAASEANPAVISKPQPEELDLTKEDVAEEAPVNIADECINEEANQVETVEALEVESTEEQAGEDRSETAGEHVEFDRIFEDVVFVISGLVNPERADLRRKAIEMGGRYAVDWGRDTTHLFSAFERTPKLRKMKQSGHGIALLPDYVYDCYETRKRLAERSYEVDTVDESD